MHSNNGRLLLLLLLRHSLRARVGKESSGRTRSVNRGRTGRNCPVGSSVVRSVRDPFGLLFRTKLSLQGLVISACKFFITVHDNT